MKLFTMIYRDFKHWTKPSYWLLALGLVVQLYLLFTAPLTASAVLTTIGALSGIVTVLMISNKKTSNGIFGIISALIIIYNAWQHQVFADALLQIGYIAVLDIPVLLLWSKHEDAENGEVTGIQKLTSLVDWTKYIALVAVITVVFTYLLGLNVVGDKQPFVDALGFAIGITGGVLCVQRNQSQFIFWALQGLVSIFLWFRASMIAGTGFASPLAVMYIFYLLNDLVGWFSYGESLEESR